MTKSVLKVYVDVGEAEWLTNGMEFDSYEAAKEHGNGIMGRWMAVREFAIIPTIEGFVGSLRPEAIKMIRMVVE